MRSTRAIVMGLALVVGGTVVVSVRVAHGNPTGQGPLAGRHVPGEPYPVDPHAIPFESLSLPEKAAVETIQENVELGQPASSYDVYASAVVAAQADVLRQLAEREASLEDTAQDGVVP